LWEDPDLRYQAKAGKVLAKGISSIEVYWEEDHWEVVLKKGISARPGRKGRDM